MSKISDTASKLAWPKGTDKKKYAYPKGNPAKAYNEACARHFGKLSKLKKSRCDLSVALAVAEALDLKMPKGNEEQLKWKPKKKLKRKVHKNRRPIDVSKPGYIIVYQKKNGRHSVIRAKKGDKEGIYQAQYKKTFFHWTGSLKKLKTKRKKVAVFYEG